MSSKTIVVIIQSRQDVDRLVKAVVPLAKRLGSHIVGVHAEPLPVPMTTGLGFPDAEFVITTGEINRKRATRARDAVQGAARRGAASVRMACHRKLLGRQRDRRTRHRQDGRPGRGIGSGIGRVRSEPRPRRPAARYRTAGPAGAAVRLEGRVRRARCWLPGTAPHEAARAAFDALPFIMEADETIVVTIDHSDDPQKSAGRLAAALSRHGAHVTVNELSSGGRPVADILAEQVAHVGRRPARHGRLWPFAAARIPVRRRHPLDAEGDAGRDLHVALRPFRRDMRCFYCQYAFSRCDRCDRCDRRDFGAISFCCQRRSM